MRGGWLQIGGWASPSLGVRVEVERAEERRCLAGRLPVLWLEQSPEWLSLSFSFPMCGGEQHTPAAYSQGFGGGRGEKGVARQTQSH